MKKLVLATALVAAFSSQVMAATNQVTGSNIGTTTAGKATDGSTPGENSGVVRFKGKVVDQTCTVATESQDQIVVLDTVSKNRFTAAGDTAMPTPFEIKLANCSVNQTGKATKVKARFASVANVDTANHYTLKNTKTTNNATHVNIQLFNADGVTAIAPMQRTTTGTPPTHKSDDLAKFVDITEANQVLRYVAKYYATDVAANITTGEVESAVDFELTYE